MVLSCNSETPCCYRYDVAITSGNSSLTAYYDLDANKGSRLKRVETDSLSLDSSTLIAFKIDLFDSIVKSYCNLDLQSIQVNKAFASSSCDPQYHLVDVFDSLSIRTLYDLDSNHQARSLVTSKFSFVNSESSSEFLTDIEKYDISEEPLSFGEVRRYWFILQEKPDSVNVLQFEFEFSFKSGRVVSIKTLPALVKD